jgi:hypothetical protein
VAPLPRSCCARPHASPLIDGAARCVCYRYRPPPYAVPGAPPIEGAKGGWCRLDGRAPVCPLPPPAHPPAAAHAPDPSNHVSNRVDEHPSDSSGSSSADRLPPGHEDRQEKELRGHSIWAGSCYYTVPATAAPSAAHGHHGQRAQSGLSATTGEHSAPNPLRRSENLVVPPPLIQTVPATSAASSSTTLSARLSPIE